MSSNGAGIFTTKITMKLARKRIQKEQKAEITELLVAETSIHIKTGGTTPYPQKNDAECGIDLIFLNHKAEEDLDSVSSEMKNKVEREDRSEKNKPQMNTKY